MELFFLILTVLVGFAEGFFLIWGYVSHCYEISEPKWRKTLKSAFLFGFFGCWFLWNIFRNF